MAAHPAITLFPELKATCVAAINVVVVVYVLLIAKVFISGVFALRLATIVGSNMRVATGGPECEVRGVDLAHATATATTGRAKPGYPEELLGPRAVVLQPSQARVDMVKG